MTDTGAKMNRRRRLSARRNGLSDHDDELEWPFQGVITVQILNHITNSAHPTQKEFIFKDGG